MISHVDLHVMHKVDNSEFFIFVIYILNDIDNNFQLKLTLALPHLDYQHFGQKHL